MSASGNMQIDRNTFSITGGFYDIDTMVERLCKAFSEEGWIQFDWGNEPVRTDKCEHCGHRHFDEGTEEERQAIKEQAIFFLTQALDIDRLF